MYEIISFQNKARWEETLNELAIKDVFYHYSYSSVCKSLGDGEPHLFYYEDESGNRLCYVFLKRKINELAFVGDEDIEQDIYDIITPSYGYGGPIYDWVDKKLMKQFRKEFESYCQKENIICEFIRFHPLLQNHKDMEDMMDVSFDRETVVIDLTRSEADILEQYHKNHKRNIKKANRNQLKFKVFMNKDAINLIDDFYKLYKETMDKLNASEYSYFSTDYLQELLSGYTNKSMIGVVFFEDKMIAAALCLYDGSSLHYHLGCSQKQFLPLGGNIYLLHNIALWGKQHGLHVFHLGGGHVGRDSLFQYKYRFNESGLLDFWIGRKVHNPRTYQLLVEKWEKYYGQESNRDFFPIYRSKPKNSSLPLRL